MSHLTANPFSKHFEFPRAGPLLTPPDTESEYPNQSLLPPPAPSPAPLALGIDLGDPLPVSSHRSVPSAATEVPPLRKGSSLQYIHSGPREARERVVQRGIRWLVVVVPPLSVVTEHGHFGHTLSVGSPEKLAHGMLMPLFPTMNGQLAAIAREFAFPSTAGLCLYLHTKVDDVTMTPRISDESWQMLWAAYFEPRSPTTGILPGQLPLSGRIEFDIDLRKARWYEAWLGFGRRDLVDVPVSVTPSRPQSISHWRGDSRTTFLDEQPDDQIDSASLLTIARGPSRLAGNGHGPRKLSLLGRIDAVSLRSGSKLAPRNLSPPSPGPLLQNAAHSLSPVVQEDEPHTARKDVNMLVNSWRASASLAAGSPLAATGQTSLDPANMPNDLPIVESALDEELNLDDFAWSVSSYGPLDIDAFEDDDDMCSIESWRLPSVHLDRRLAGSVCLTPSTQTSWGPIYDYDDDFSSMSSISRLPSPDIAARILEDCPPTPSTATSWGPPSCPASPSVSEASFTLSVDIGQRCAGSVLLTPSTATSWGPPLEWPPSPATPYHARTPDVGQRAFDIDEPRSQVWRHVWPYQLEGSARFEDTIESESVSGPWKLVWPYHASATGTEPTESTGPYPFVYPYYNALSQADPSTSTSEPWRQVWPYNAARSDASDHLSGPYPFVFPWYNPASHEGAAEERGEAETWKQVWPYYHADAVQGTLAAAEVQGGPYPFVFPYYHGAQTTTTGTSETMAIGDGNNEQDNKPWTHVWPYINVSPEQNYPYLSIYSAVYPHHDLYPTPAAESVGIIALKELPVKLEPVYPTIRPYTAGYPHIELYPPVSLASASAVKPTSDKDILLPVSLKVTAVYPAIDIYPAVYPHGVDEIYGPSTTESTPSTISTDLLAVYPVIEPYQHVYPYNLHRMYPTYSALEKQATAPLEVVSELNTPVQEHIALALKADYPNMCPYEPVYPWNLDHIYPAVCSVESADDVEDPSAYPGSLQHIYSPLLTLEVQDVNLSSPYHALPIFSPVYPWNLDHIYPSEEFGKSHLAQDSKSVVVGLPAHYPHIELYASVYPYNLQDIYPPVDVLKGAVSPRATKSVAVSARSSKPHLREHAHHAKRSSGARLPPPPVPPLPQNVEVLRPIHPNSRRPLSGERVAMSLPVRLPTFYPMIRPYPPAYPHLELYPVRASTVSTEDSIASVRLLEAKYPSVEIYPALYPFIEIYPQAAASSYSSLDTAVKTVIVVSNGFLPRRPPKRTHDELHRMVFGSNPVEAIAAEQEISYQGQDTVIVKEAIPEVPQSPATPKTPRRLPPVPPPQIPLPAIPSTPLMDTQSNNSSNIVPTPSPSPSPSPAQRSRARSGTVSARPPLPIPPTQLSAPVTSPSPSPTVRKLPAVPEDSPSPSPIALARRPLSMRSPVGLPPNPAAKRRMSVVGRSASFTPLPPLPEPSGLVPSVPTVSPVPVMSPVSPRRPLPPQPQMQPERSPPPPADLQRSNSGSVRQSLAPPADGAADLARRKSLPARPLPRARRDSVAGSGGIVAGMARAYNASKLDTVDERLPTSPPQVPLPPIPNNRPLVSKLDRSRYPFA